MDCNGPLGSSVHGIFQIILEWVAISYSRDLCNSGIELVSLVPPGLAGGFTTASPGNTNQNTLRTCLVAQWLGTCLPMQGPWVCSLLGEWVAISFSNAGK